MLTFICRFHRAAFIFIANMALADMVIVIVEIADVVLKQMKDNVITATFKVVYMSSSFWLLALKSRDLP